jgi:hypothetical protein
MNEYTNVQYMTGKSGENHCIKANINGSDKDSFIPLSSGNKDYDEIMRQVEAGDLTIAAAD